MINEINETDLQTIRAEFAKYASPPEWQEGDIDVVALAAALGVAETTARTKMKRIAEEKPQRYQRIEVKRGNFTILVLRKVA